jgi:D-threonate/D-erythronate kinase
MDSRRQYRRRLSAEKGEVTVMPSSGKVFVVADDLTGAADAAVAFAARGSETRIVLDPSHASLCDAEVVAVSIESRDVPRDELASHNAILYPAIRKGLLCFRKIDSIFRGNTFAEVALIAHAMPDIPIVLAPAYPALGRKLVSGSLHWSDETHPGKLSVEDLLREHGVQSVHVGVDETDTLTALLCSYEKSRPAVFLCDASEQPDLDRIVETGFTAGRPTLWMGSGGLAQALAEHLSSSHPRRETKVSRGGVIFIVGSDHPITLRQLQYLRAEQTDTTVIVPVVRGVTTADEIRSATMAVPHPEIGCVFMTGGDTAMFACRALEVESLTVESEFAPGVPAVRIGGGVLDGKAAVLKSGGFGEAKLLCRIAQFYRDAKEDAA